MTAAELGRRLPGALALGIHGFWLALYVAMSFVRGGPGFSSHYVPAILTGAVVAGLGLIPHARIVLLFAGISEVALLGILAFTALHPKGLVMGAFGLAMVAFFAGSFGVAQAWLWTLGALTVIVIFVPFIAHMTSGSPAAVATLPVSAVLLALGAWLLRPVTT